MTYFAEYKKVDGMTFVRVVTPRGSLVSYGRTQSIALFNLMGKYRLRYKEAARIELGEPTTDPIENEVAVRRNKNSEWWYKNRERRAALGLAQDEDLPHAQEEPEYVYDIEDGYLKVYRVTLEKEYKVKETPKNNTMPKIDLGVMGGAPATRLPAEPGMVLFNADKGASDVA